MKKIDYEFEDENYLKRALITSDFADKTDVSDIGHQEALEKYGDALIGFFAIEKGVKKGLAEKDKLHDFRTKYTENKFLVRIAKKLRLRDYVKWSETQRNQKHWKTDEVYADCVEAIIGAIYQDSGILEAKKKYWKLVSLVKKRIY